MDRLRAHVGPLWPYLVLTAVPAAVFVLPDLFGGHLLMSGDNVTQNYPLHVLVGSMLRRGQLPFWNQYIFSGSPLLAGFNAGALYPLMVLFVVLPDRAAWVATEVVLLSVMAVGMYSYLRALRLSTTACFLAALTFVFSGTAFNQINHIDMTEGFTALPWMLLAVLHIMRDGRWRWSIVLGIAYATVILGGAPEAMLDEAILVVVYAVASCGFDRTRWWRVLTRAGAGAALGLSLAAIQWLPGLNNIANSQRATFGSGFASTGSFPPPFGVLSLVPYLFGGYAHLGESTYFSHYNLAEVGIYVGILPLVALVTLLHRRWPSRLAPRERAIWYLVGLVGLLLAFGANTPLEHLFNSLPLYGHQRLQSRNMIDVSTAVCVLFAGWIDRTGSPRDTFLRYDRVMAILPFALVAALATWALADPASLLRVLGDVSHPNPRDLHTVREATLIALGICAAAAGVAWLRARLPSGWWLLLLTAFVALDIGTTAVYGQLSTIPSNKLLSGRTPVENYVAAHLVPDGRFDVYDPQNYGGASHNGTGLPDLNILARLPSVAGYASIVNGDYSVLTNTHTLGDLNISQLANGTLDGLDLQDVVTVPEYFLLPVAGHPTTLGSVEQVPESHHVDPVLPLGNGPNFDDKAYPFYPQPRPALAVGQTSSWFFGESLHASAATLLFSGRSTTAVIRFGAVSSDGTTVWSRAVLVHAGATSVTASLPSGGSVGVAVQVLFGQVPRSQGLVTVGTESFELDGSLSSALRPGVWRQQGRVEGYTLFVRIEAPTPIYALVGGDRHGPAVKVEKSLTKLEVVRVRATEAVTVVRNVAWDPGWQGEVSVNGGPTRSVAVAHHGLVQEIAAPAGNDVVTFRYEPPHLLVSSILSLGGLAVVLGSSGMMLVRRRRRRAE